MLLYFLVVQDIWGKGIFDFSLRGQGMDYMGLFGTVVKWGEKEQP